MEFTGIYCSARFKIRNSLQYKQIQQKYKTILSNRHNICNIFIGFLCLLIIKCTTHLQTYPISNANI
ncbi:hypothetical protein BLOT_004265 [Blomia tropicalis]|nr:hypothetical protein BLOT_004265 [Blomia tropicalis]